MTRFSANLGFLWTDRALPDAIRAAHAAGFDAVECHYPYDTPRDAVAQALAETGLPMLGLNTRRGDVAAGDNGLCALPGREGEARAAIDEALEYATAIGAGAVHVMAGKAQGAEAQAVFLANLRYACARAIAGAKAGGKSGAKAGAAITILIEPLNPCDAPGYFLNSTAQAADIISEIAEPNLRLMFDCYHVGRTEGDVIARLQAIWPILGHIQFAAVPDRGPPDRGTVAYRAIFAELARMGWTKPLGAEYRPDGATDDSLGWIDRLR